MSLELCGDIHDIGIVHVIILNKSDIECLLFVGHWFENTTMFLKMQCLDIIFNLEITINYCTVFFFFLAKDSKIRFSNNFINLGEKQRTTF